MKKYDLGIVGGSASGLIAAINAKYLHPDISVVIFEKNQRLGKKILATGNGRCNLTNIHALDHEYTNSNFAQHSLKKYSSNEVIEFFSKLGLLTYADEKGRVYPRSNTASSVLDALRFEIEKLNVDVILDYPVSRVTHTDKFIINDEFICDKLIIATGGKSSPSQGSDGSGYKIAKSLGHSITPLYPSLVPLNSRPEFVRSLKGIRAISTYLKITDGITESKSEGEILFTDNGVSGIAAMELASTAEKILHNGNKPVLEIDFLPEVSFDELKIYLNSVIEHKQGQSMDNLLAGILPKQIGIQILKNCNIYYGGAVISDFSENMISEIAKSIKDFTLEITGTKGFANSQVTCGGVNCKEINKETMQSLLIDNLYFCGEIIDVDGRCGGFNLQWAFASGLTAGELK